MQGSRKRTKCGNCNGCQQIYDCGTCSNSLDKTNYGGPGRKTQCCTKKKCMLGTQNPISEYRKKLLYILLGSGHTNNFTEIANTVPNTLPEHLDRAFAQVSSWLQCRMWNSTYTCIITLYIVIKLHCIGLTGWHSLGYSRCDNSSIN